MAKSGRILRLNPRNPSREAIREIIEVLKRGDILAFPTDTVYGLGGMVKPRIYRGIARLKKRNPSKPIGIFVPSVGYLSKLGATAPGYAKRLMQRFWPGPLTLVLRLDGNKLRGVFHKRAVGIRIPKEKWLLRVLKQIKSPLLQTSANLSGRREARSAKEVFEIFGTKVSLIVNVGLVRRSQFSTVVDARGKEPTLIREGAIRRITLERALKRKIRYA